MLKIFKQSKHILDLLKISNFLLLHYRTCWFQEIELNKMDNVMTALSKEHFYGKSMQKMWAPILFNNPKQPMQERNSFENKIF